MLFSWRTVCALLVEAFPLSQAMGEAPTQLSLCGNGLRGSVKKTNARDGRFFLRIVSNTKTAGRACLSWRSSCLREIS
ncbi:hypothetical protein MPNT_80020 [Candidatus Methylacidithermus pantelleriae]|uniref:Uncharacterized protein n=1 Tax=Candidatus Methylacidithermus pantelleriae TaxID=2744239 RepID=A0A8J2BVV2_9BACT|nr:hypothetical protein MPNT_80020 [Candidatus Methylacidithermus pantelleriae]